MKTKPFRFKQFLIIQEKSVMKVGTDGVLLGSWTQANNAKQILDIGSGTGLIALMLAQKSEAKVVAVDIDSEATQEAELNFGSSKWHNRLIAINDSIQEFSKNTDLKFDLIVSNPPYFDSQAETSQRSTARSQQHLKLDELIESSTKILTKDGRINLIIPYAELDAIENLCAIHSLYINRLLYIRGNHKSPVKRIALEISYSKSETLKEEIAIEKEKRHDYTEKYRALLKDYLTIF